MEISDFEVCGTTHVGGARHGDNVQFWRRCDPNQMDMYCKDRIRLELTRSSLTMYVNGHLYFQDAGWPADRQLPDAMVDGGQVYVYFSDWRARPTAPAYRFHWGRLAVNPHDENGNLAPPSASPFFCLGMPQNTCDLSRFMGGAGAGQQTMPGMSMPMPGMDMPGTDMPGTTDPASAPADGGS
jgi:hypothetical protein